MNNDKNKCPDHPEKDNLYCSECIKRISAEAQANTAKEIFKELDKIKCKGNHKGSATYDNDKYMDVIHVEDYEALKKKYKVD